MVACVVGLVVALVFLNKFVVDRLFRLFAVSDEMLFIVTFAYALGVSGIMALIPGGTRARPSELTHACTMHSLEHI